MATRERLPLDLARIREFGMRHPIERLALVGSALRSDFGDTSDVDVLVELRPGSGVGMFAMQRMQDELETIVQRRVDLRTPDEMSDYIRQRVLDEAEVIYVRR